MTLFLSYPSLPDHTVRSQGNHNLPTTISSSATPQTLKPARGDFSKPHKSRKKCSPALSSVSYSNASSICPTSKFSTLQCTSLHSRLTSLNSNAFSEQRERGVSFVGGRERSLRFPVKNMPRFGPVFSSVEGSVGHAIEECSQDKMDEFVEVGHNLADAARKIILKYFRSGFQIIDKADMSPVTIADRGAEEAMRRVLAELLPSHAIYGEEWGLTMPEGGSDYVWVLDPIDGTKSFITGKPVFGTLIALVHKGVPVLGIIDQPVLNERWLGVEGRVTTLNGVELQTRSTTTLLKDAYLYSTSPHLFAGEAEEAFIRVRNKVKTPLYGCDCYAYGLLAAGHIDLVVESGLKPYDYLALVPVVEGAGGVITNWDGDRLHWLPETGEVAVEVVAAGSETLQKAALAALEWRCKSSSAR